MTTDYESIRRGLAQQLKLLRLAGVRDLPVANNSLNRLPAGVLDRSITEQVLNSPPIDTPTLSSSSSGRMAEMAVSEAAASFGEPDPAADRGNRLNVIRDEVAACIKCESLAASRTQTVFGVGDPNARLCFVGEAPGADEDRQGEPFVGKAGQLLDRIINACEMSREDVFILNTIKCRPPGNRNPSETEISNCWGFGLRQLEIIQPEFICCLGSVAANVVLGLNQSVGKLRGQFHDLRGSKVIVTYHPAYLLRNDSAKRLVWDDMKMLMTEMGREL